MSNQDYKVYRWNRNAAAHRESLVRFSIIACLPSVLCLVLVGVPFAYLDTTRDNVHLFAVVIVCTFLATWLVSFSALSYTYYALNEIQYKPSPPTPQKHPEKGVVAHGVGTIPVNTSRGRVGEFKRHGS